MKNILVVFLLIVTMNGYGKTPQSSQLDSGYTFLYNVQFRADFKTQLEYQLVIFRPQKLSFSLKIANVNYVGENLSVRVNSSSNNSFGITHAVKGFTIKPGIFLPIELGKKSLIYIGLNGVFSHITNEVNLSNITVGYNETNRRANYLFGAELEFSEMMFISKHFHLGISEVIGYKNMNVYDLESVIDNFPVVQNYSPTQGYSLLPIYISMAVFLGVNF